MARIKEESRSWDEKSKLKRVFSPLTPEEFIKLHTSIWGSLEFCRDCTNIVYDGECSDCKGRDQNGKRYIITNASRNGLFYDLIQNHLDTISQSREDIVPLRSSSIRGVELRPLRFEIRNEVRQIHENAGLAPQGPALVRADDVVILYDEEDGD